MEDDFCIFHTSNFLPSMYCLGMEDLSSADKGVSSDADVRKKRNLWCVRMDMGSVEPMRTRGIDFSQFCADVFLLIFSV